MESLCFTPSSLQSPPFSLRRRGLCLPPDHRRRSRPFIISATAASNSSAAVISAEETLTMKPDSRSTAVLKRVSADSLHYHSGFLGATPDKSFSSADDAPPVSAMEYLTNILSSKVYDVAMESPLQFAERLSETLGTNVFLKREDLQPVRMLQCCLISLLFENELNSFVSFLSKNEFFAGFVFGLRISFFFFFLVGFSLPL